MGGYCGYLATTAGIASGADSVYINEIQASVNDISQNCYHMMGDGWNSIQYFQYFPKNNI